MLGCTRPIFTTFSANDRNMFAGELSDRSSDVAVVTDLANRIGEIAILHRHSAHQHFTTG